MLYRETESCRLSDVVDQMPSFSFIVGLSSIVRGSDRHVAFERASGGLRVSIDLDLVPPEGDYMATGRSDGGNCTRIPLRAAALTSTGICVSSTGARACVLNSQRVLAEGCAMNNQGITLSMRSAVDDFSSPDGLAYSQSQLSDVEAVVTSDRL